MKKETKAFLVILLFLVSIALAAFGVWLHQLKLPNPKCGKMWDKSCTYIVETGPDSSLKSPSSIKLYLTAYAYNQALGEAQCKPYWYAIRYVNSLTGGYSDFSGWTSSPIVAGGKNLPYSPDITPPKSSSCTYNLPTIGVEGLDYNPFTSVSGGGFIYANIHKYIGEIGDTKPPLSPTSENTTIIGMLMLETKLNNKQYYTWLDVSPNPCQTGCYTCPGC